MNALDEAANPTTIQTGARLALIPQLRTHENLRLRALMDSVQQGDRSAYDALVRELVPLLKRLMGRKLALMQASDREDLIQDVLLSVHTARDAYDASRPFIPWLMSIAHKRAVDRTRRHRKLWAYEVLVDEFSDSSAAPEVSHEDFGDADSLRRAVDSLPARQRTAIELVKFRELSLKEAAALSGLSTSALKISVHRAIKSLRGSLVPLSLPGLDGGARAPEHWKGTSRPGSVGVAAGAFREPRAA